ncbi:MAG: type II secretion system protein [Burkholderiaceae bacterium]|jgi:hypothetical protein
MAAGKYAVAHPVRPSGFTYVLALIAICILGLASVRFATVWQIQRQRAQEAELLRIGQTFRRAIRSYYENGPGSVKRFPRTLDDLLLDDRFLNIRRHLRRIPVDPLTGEARWGLLAAPEGGLMGVYSLANGEPLKTANFAAAEQTFGGALGYRDWQFFYRPVDAAP